PQPRRGLPHGDEGRLSDLFLTGSRLLRAREAILASGESAGHQRAGIREQGVGLLVERARGEPQPGELLANPHTFHRRLPSEMSSAPACSPDHTAPGAPTPDFARCRPRPTSSATSHTTGKRTSMEDTAAIVGSI